MYKNIIKCNNDLGKDFVLLVTLVLAANVTWKLHGPISKKLRNKGPRLRYNIAYVFAFDS